MLGWPPGAGVDDAQPTKDLLCVPVVQRAEVGVKIEGNEGVLLLLVGIVVRPIGRPLITLTLTTSTLAVGVAGYKNTLRAVRRATKKLTVVKNP